MYKYLPTISYLWNHNKPELWTNLATSQVPPQSPRTVACCLPSGPDGVVLPRAWRQGQGSPLQSMWLGETGFCWTPEDSTRFLGLFKVIFYFPNGKSTIRGISSEYVLPQKSGISPWKWMNIGYSIPSSCDFDDKPYMIRGSLIFKPRFSSCHHIWLWINTY